MAMKMTPGTYVRNPLAPEWGIGQVQSAIGDRITVNFDDAGKRLVNAAEIELEEIVDPAAYLRP